MLKQHKWWQLQTNESTSGKTNQYVTTGTRIRPPETWDVRHGPRCFWSPLVLYYHVQNQAVPATGSLATVKSNHLDKSPGPAKLHAKFRMLVFVAVLSTNMIRYADIIKIVHIDRIFMWIMSN